MKYLLVFAALLFVAVTGSAQSTAAPTTLLRSYDSLVSGDESVSADGREDSFVVAAPADGRLTVTVVSTDFVPLIGVSVGSLPPRLGGGRGESAHVSVRAREGDRITITVTAEATGRMEFADYLISAVLSEGDSELIAGGSVLAELSEDDETDFDGSYIDWYDLVLPEDTRIRIDLSSPDFDTFLRLELPDGRTMENDDSRGTDSSLSFDTGAGGLARVGATSYGYASTGEYTLEVSIVQSRPIRVGQRVTGELSGAEESYLLIGEPGELVQIDLSSDDFDTYLELSDAHGAYLSNDDAGHGTNSRLVYEIVDGAQATIAVSGFGGSSGGSYTLEVSTVTYDGPVIADGYRLFDGEVIEGVLGPHLSTFDGAYRQRFTFDAGRGERIQIVLRSDDFDSFLTVVAPDGHEQTDDDSAGGYDAQLVLVTEQSGVYEVFASDFGAGAFGEYTLSFARMGEARLLLDTRGALTSGSDTDISGKHYAVYRFSVTGGRLVTIDVRSADFDGYAIVRSASGAILHRDDDGGGNMNPRIVFTAEQSEVLELVVTTYGAEETGDYSVSIYD